MARRLLIPALALLALLAPCSALAEEDASPPPVVTIHHAVDLHQRIPELVVELARLVPDAEITESRPGILIVKSTPGVQSDFALILAALRRDLAPPRKEGSAADLVKRALERAKANKKTLAQLGAASLSLSAEETAASEVLGMLAQVAGLNVVLSPDAGRLLAEQTLTLEADDVTARHVLDLLLAQADLRPSLEAGILRVVTAKEAIQTTIFLDFRHVPTEDEWEKAVQGPVEADNLKTLVQALHEEVRALREEVREVRSILEEIRDR